jgi:hypothetical protein
MPGKRARPVREGAVGKGPEPRAPRRRPTSLIQALKESGELVTTQALVDPSQAAVVSVRGGRPVVTDGPFLEAKEFLGGFYLVDCEDRDRAIELASQIPDAAIEGLGVEVRQVMFADGNLEA